MWKLFDQRGCWFDSQEWHLESHTTSLTCPPNLWVMCPWQTPKGCLLSSFTFVLKNNRSVRELLRVLKVCSIYENGPTRRTSNHQIWSVRWSPGWMLDSVWGRPCHSCQCAALWLMVLPTVGEGKSGGRERKALIVRVGWSVFSPCWLKRCLVFHWIFHKQALTQNLSYSVFIDMSTCFEIDTSFRDVLTSHTSLDHKDIFFFIETGCDINNQNNPKMSSFFQKTSCHCFDYDKNILKQIDGKAEKNINTFNRNIQVMWQKESINFFQVKSPVCGNISILKGSAWQKL